MLFSRHLFVSYFNGAWATANVLGLCGKSSMTGVQCPQIWWSRGYHLHWSRLKMYQSIQNFTIHGISSDIKHFEFSVGQISIPWAKIVFRCPTFGSSSEIKFKGPYPLPPSKNICGKNESQKRNKITLRYMYIYPARTSTVPQVYESINISLLKI